MSEEEKNIEEVKKPALKPAKNTKFASAYLLIKNLPYIFFVGFLATIYIANAHFAEKKVRDIQVLQKEMKENRWKYMSLKSQLMFNSKQVEVAKQVAPLGLKELTTKPKKIVAAKGR